MADKRNVKAAARAAAPRFMLDRCEVVPALIGQPEDFLHVTGLGGAIYDITSLTNHGNYFFGLGGAMGGACMIGLGLALAQPHKRVLVTTGDGELLMNLGSLTTIAVMNPPNLSILCVDNGHYGETGYQVTHTAKGADLEIIAQGAGIKQTRTVASTDDIAEGARILREGNGTSFVLVSVKPTEAPRVKLNLDGAVCREIFRKALLKAS